MAKFDINSYETVEDRLKKFWADNPNGRIQTYINTISQDGTMVVIGCDVYKDIDDDRPVSTGFAQEYKGQGGFANTEAWLENCETSAIGRALANWKYQGSDKARPSQEEMKKVSSSKPLPKENKAEVKSTDSTEASASSPIKEIADAGYGNRRQDKHPGGELAIDDTGLLCPCGAKVKYYKGIEKAKPTSPDFRCTAMGQCTAGDTVDGKVFAKSWWMDNKATPESWKDYAAVANGMKMPEIKSMDDIDNDAAPF